MKEPISIYLYDKAKDLESEYSITEVYTRGFREDTEVTGLEGFNRDSGIPLESGSLLEERLIAKVEREYSELIFELAEERARDASDAAYDYWKENHDE